MKAHKLVTGTGTDFDAVGYDAPKFELQSNTRRNLDQGPGMNTLLPELERLFGPDKNIPTDRAAQELRNGRPIVIETEGNRTLAAALDGIAPNLFDVIAGLHGARLTLSANRGRAIGLAVESDFAVDLGGMDPTGATRLTTATGCTPPDHWSLAGPEASAAIAVCKYALLLPAALTAPLKRDFHIPAGLHRVALDSLGHSDAPESWTLEIVSEAFVPLKGNIETRFVVFRGGPAPRDQVAIIVGNPNPAMPVPVRVHSACLTGDLFGSLRCDCGDQLKNAVARLAASGGGVLIYLDQEGRGIGIGNKMRAYALQSAGFDTVDADAVLGFSADERRFGYAAAMLRTLGFTRIVLLTNNPAKLSALSRAGIEVASRQPLTGAVTAQNLHYLHTKARKSDHMLDELLNPKTQ